MNHSIRHTCEDFTSYRAERVKSLFNCEDGFRFAADFDIPVENADWSIGLVVGPSGSGKTSLAKKLGKLHTPRWPRNVPIIDAIAPDGDFDAVTGALTAVGLGSVPAWLRPYQVLSNGEKFRSDLARLIATRPNGTVCVDEFTSVVDRHIARIGAAAFAKAWRRVPGKIVLITCHYDVAEWLCPDWILDTASGKFSGDCLRPGGSKNHRPPISLEIHKTRGAVWRHFEPHHYLKLPPMVAAQHYVGFVGDEPVAHLAFSCRFDIGSYLRACRLVVMPEWQGVGVGLNFLDECCRQMMLGNNRWDRPCYTFFHTSHPGLVSALRRKQQKDESWLHISAATHGSNKAQSRRSMRKSAAKNPKAICTTSGYGGHLRAVHGFKYIGAAH